VFCSFSENLTDRQAAEDGMGLRPLLNRRRRPGRGRCERVRPASWGGGRRRRHRPALGLLHRHRGRRRCRHPTVCGLALLLYLPAARRALARTCRQPPTPGALRDQPNGRVKPTARSAPITSSQCLGPQVSTCRTTSASSMCSRGPTARARPPARWRRGPVPALRQRLHQGR
jgi:hypothetical protein